VASRVIDIAVPRMGIGQSRTRSVFHAVKRGS
jgi:hypothetical protein